MNDDAIFLNSPAMLDFVEKGMLKRLNNPTRQFLFLYIWIMGHKSIDAAEVLNVHPTNISRHLKKMRKRLSVYKRGYKDDFDK